MFTSEHYFTKIMQYAKNKDIGVFDATVAVADDLEMEVEDLLEKLDENVIKLIKDDAIERKIHIPTEPQEESSILVNSLF